MQHLQRSPKLAVLDVGRRVGTNSLQHEKGPVLSRALGLPGVTQIIGITLDRVEFSKKAGRDRPPSFEESRSFSPWRACTSDALPLQLVLSRALHHTNDDGLYGRWRIGSSMAEQANWRFCQKCQLMFYGS